MPPLPQTLKRAAGEPTVQEMLLALLPSSTPAWEICTVFPGWKTGACAGVSRSISLIPAWIAYRKHVIVGSDRSTVVLSSLLPSFVNVVVDLEHILGGGKKKLPID